MITTDQRAELDAAMATIGAPICPEWMYSAIRHCQRNMDIDVSDGFNEPDRRCGGDIAQIVNAYPLLTATIDAQAAEIARLREALAAMLLTHDAGGVTLGAAKDARAALASTGAS